MSLIVSKCRIPGCLRLSRWTPVITVPFQHPKTAIPMRLTFDDGVCDEHKSAKTSDYLTTEDINREDFKAYERGLTLDWPEISIQFYPLAIANGPLATSFITKGLLDELDEEKRLRERLDNLCKPMTKQ
jgi:hypothetical protein